jgi:hypothetical protein
VNTNQLNQIDDVLSNLDKLQGASAVTLVFLSCIVVGYILRFIKPFPNNAIPVVVVLWGGMFMSLIASGRATTMPMHVWVIRNALVGLIIGGAAWIAHYVVISRIETWVQSKFPGTQDTTLFKKEPNAEPVKPPTNPS